MVRKIYLRRQSKELFELAFLSLTLILLMTLQTTPQITMFPWFN